MKLTERQAIKMSMEKWDSLRNNDMDYSLECGFCMKYARQDCKKCPLCELWGKKCFSDGTPYDRWYWASTDKTEKKYAEIIYQDIKSLLKPKKKNGGKR